MSDPRWTGETEGLMARLLAVGAYDATDAVGRATFHFGARTILGSLADAGLLVPVDADRDEQRGVFVPKTATVSSCGTGLCVHTEEEQQRARVRTFVSFTTPWAEVETGSQP